MSFGPVTACATETPGTPRILEATSRAFPGDVSIRMNAFTAIEVSSPRAARCRHAFSVVAESKHPSHHIHKIHGQICGRDIQRRRTSSVAGTDDTCRHPAPDASPP